MTKIDAIERARSTVTEYYGGVWHSFPTRYFCRARDTKQFWFSSRGRSPFKNSPCNEKLFANRNKCIVAQDVILKDFFHYCENTKHFDAKKS